LAEVVQHLAVVLGGGEADLFAAYQSRLGRGLFDS
jgi:hypothetical protein